MDVPFDVWCCIAKYLTLEDVVALSSTCCGLRCMINSYMMKPAIKRELKNGFSKYIVIRNIEYWYNLIQPIVDNSDYVEIDDDPPFIHNAFHKGYKKFMDMHTNGNLGLPTASYDIDMYCGGVQTEKVCKMSLIKDPNNIRLVDNRTEKIVCSLLLWMAGLLWI